MSENIQRLKGETIVFTGSRKPEEAVSRVEELGGKALYLPLIETSIRQSEIPSVEQYDWLIFTSATSAEAFCQLHVSTRAKIAAVGEKTAETLEQHGYQVDFIPSIYSADVFIKEFPAFAGSDVKCLFVKGTLAKSTIASMPLQIDEWTIYETSLKIGNAHTLMNMKELIVIFASPSAVSAYREAGGDWSGIRTAAIGHITENAIKQNGGRVDYRPKKYTYLEVINEIAKGSCKNDRIEF
ncbi:uroporphyrinogen-III synthase [Planococcus massiliensis]|uniref:Uroporphyrinogen-III synthase n=1 Tax=Planococcus massiliensis TaxID=1499687 RepID=A0A098EMT2_9BACL|nr:uroporphyrinogen-III synthase [Planococcus massiliensis]CEG23102.1 uroporphyrinogen-III synthase [Planococcus massiliensis]